MRNSSLSSQPFAVLRTPAAATALLALVGAALAGNFVHSQEPAAGATTSAEARVLSRLGAALATLESDPARAAAAIEPLRREAAKTPLADEVEYWYAVALDRAHKPDEAVEAYRATIRLSPRGRYSAPARAAHQRLTGKEASTPADRSTPENLWRSFALFVESREHERAFECMSPRFRAVYTLEEFSGVLDASRESVLRHAAEGAVIAASPGDGPRAGTVLAVSPTGSSQRSPRRIPVVRVDGKWFMDLWP